MTNLSKLWSSSEFNKTLEKGYYKTNRNRYERDRMLWKYIDITKI